MERRSHLRHRLRTRAPESSCPHKEQCLSTLQWQYVAPPHPAAGREWREPGARWAARGRGAVQAPIEASDTSTANRSEASTDTAHESVESPRTPAA
eukprot:2634063-Prorocentrum_lima.AAC.1